MLKLSQCAAVQHVDPDRLAGGGFHLGVEQPGPGLNRDFIYVWGKLDQNLCQSTVSNSTYPISELAMAEVHRPEMPQHFFGGEYLIFWGE